MLRHSCFLRLLVYNCRPMASSAAEITKPTEGSDSLLKSESTKKTIKPLVIPGLTVTQTKQAEIYQQKVIKFYITLIILCWYLFYFKQLYFLLVF